jgi:hypothetical protein
MTTDAKLAKALERWRKLAKPVEAVVSTEDGKTTPIDVYRQRLDKPARMRRAVFGLVACWLLAVVSILAPVAHFVLVPGFAIAGPVIAWLRMGQESIIVGAIVDCPACGKHTKLGQNSEHWPLTLYCVHCQVGLDISERPTE